MRIAIVLGSVVAMVAVALAGPAPDHPATTDIVLAGAPDRGIFDASIAGDERQLYMALSGIGSTSAGSSLDTNAVRTYLARSPDRGASWQLVGLVNPDIAVSLEDFPSPHRGRWQSEVSALAFDPYASPKARWKLFWHQYLNVNGERRMEHGWLAYKEAETPEQLAQARPTKLFAARGYDPLNDRPEGRTRSPLPGPAAVQFDKLHKDLATCVAISEPGVLARPDGIYLAVVCFRGKLFGLLGPGNDVVLLRCARPCDAAGGGAWAYVGTLLTQKDAEKLGMRKFSAVDLFAHEGRSFVTVSPVGTVPGEGAYKGCAVFAIDDVTKAAVAREGDGRPHLEAFIGLQQESFNGACTFQPVGPHRGLVIGRVDFDFRHGHAEPTFRLFATDVRPASTAGR